MVDFEAIFKQTLKSVNDDFLIAKNDLIITVEKISATIKNNSNDSFLLHCFAVEESMKSSTFRVLFDPDADNFESDTIVISDFQIPSKGYPILNGS